MTDKEQIIVDGIQFNEFGDFYVDYDFNGKFQSISSSSKEYKILKSLIEQLARKTKECERLKIYIESNEQQVKEVETLVMDNDRLINELDQLKAENDELKKKCNIYTCGICGNKEGCNKLYKTLAEIKKIAEYHNANAYCNSKVDMRKILQKISEVEND